MLDDVEGEAAELGEPARGVLCVVTTADAGLAARLGVEHIALARSTTDGVAAIAASMRRRAPRCRSRTSPRAAAACRGARIASRPSGRARRRRAGSAAAADAHGAPSASACARPSSGSRARVVELQALRERAGARDAEPATTVCPYKGLAPFDGADAAFFFGRERLVAEMVARLAGAPLLGIVGPSGSGKSSALRAGLLPELAGGVLPGSEDWALRPAAPGRAPAAEPRGRDRHDDAARGAC